MDPSMNINFTHSATSMSSYNARPPSPSSPITIKIKEDSSIDNNQQDISSIGYGEDDFMSKTHNDLNQIRNDMKKHSISSNDAFYQDQNIDDLFYLRSDSNSPVMSILDSQYGSRTNSDVDDDDIDNSSDRADTDTSDIQMDNLSTMPVSHMNRSSANGISHNNKRFKKFRFKDIEKSINKYHGVDTDINYSSEIDILTTFIKGQKSLYIYSKISTQRKLSCLTFPALFISAALTITSPYLSCNPWNLEITSGLNACVTFLLSIISYLKLESMVEAYFQMATHLDAIQTSLELANSKFLLTGSENDIKQLTIDKFNEVEEKITEFKANNKLLIPEEVKRLFPVITHIDFFSFIKRNKMYRQKLIEKLLAIKNEIEYIHFKWDKKEQQRILNPQFNYDTSFNNGKHMKETSRLNYLYDLKKQIHEEIVDVQNIYGVLDNIFAREIRHAETKKISFLFCIPLYFCEKRSLTETYLDNIDPNIAKHFSFLYQD